MATAENIFNRGQSWLRNKLPAAAGVSVQLRAGNDVIEKLEAVPGRDDIDSYGADDAIGTARDLDWVVAESLLVLDGQKKQPEPGWEFWQELPDKRFAVWKVVNRANDRCFDAVDRLGLMYRVYTQFDRHEDEDE